MHLDVGLWGGVVRVVGVNRSRLDIFQGVGIYRPTVVFTLALLAFTAFAIAWAFQLMDHAAHAERRDDVELVLRQAAGFLARASAAEEPSGYRRSLMILVGTITLVSVAAVGTVAYLNIALVRTRKLLENKIYDSESLDVVKERFLTSVTHELNTPITVASALADSLAKNLDGNLTERQLEQLAAVRSNTRQLSDLVGEMIRTSAAEIHRGFAVETVCYSEFLGSALESLRTDIALQGIQVETSLLTVDVEVNIDIDRMNQVMTNLLVNAAHNSPEGSVVSVSAERLGETVKTSIRDSGTGISASDSDHVFSPFYRADTENARRLRGLGLGLTMVQRIIELHGGQVGFEPNLNNSGVTFWFTLPVAEQAD